MSTLPPRSRTRWIRRCAKSLLPLSILVCGACSGPDSATELLVIRQAEDSRNAGEEFLATDLREGTRPVRAAAARAFGRIGDPVAVNPLADALRHEDEAAVRAEIVFALGILGRTEALPALLDALDRETDSYVSSEIAIAIGRIGGETGLDTLHGLVDSPWGLIRERTAEALALIAVERSIDPLIRLVGDRDPGVAWRAAYALEKIDSQRQVPTLVSALASPEPMVQRAAVRSLGRLAAKDAVGPLVSVASTPHDDWQLDVRLADALGRIGVGSAPVLEVMDALLQSGSFHVQVSALQATGRAKWRDLLPRVLDLRASDVVDVRAAAYEAIADCLEGRARELLLPGLQDSSALVAATCLRRLGESTDDGVVEMLMQASAAGADRIRRLGAAEGLAAAGDRVPLERMTDMLADEDLFVATVAASALGDRGDHNAVLPLIEALDRTGGGIEDLRIAAATSLGQLADPRATSVLRKTLAAAPDPRLRLAARNALEEILPPEQAVGLPDEEAIRADVRTVARSPLQPEVVTRSTATQLILHTDRGRIRIDLFSEDAPQTVESFAYLAEEGFFDGLTFHRVVGDFVVQGGDPTGTGWGDAGYTLRSEWNPRRYGRGTVGIAHSGKDTGSCQLFITQSPQPHLDARYTVWGEVVGGMDVVDRIQRGDRFRVEVVRQAP